MRNFRLIPICLMLAALFSGCSLFQRSPKAVALTQAQLDACKKLNLAPTRIAELEAKPLYKFTEDDVHNYLGFVQETVPDLRQRIQYLARKQIGQPYELYLLGEAPLEYYDPQPLYCLDRSDCVVFSEHMYAMALSRDWPTFFRMLQRIRYHNGQIGVLTRNHYTEADWDVNNSWLVKDISEELGGKDTIHFKMTVKRANFFQKRYKLTTDIPNQTLTVGFVPFEKVKEIEDQLQPGDFVNFMRGRAGDGDYYAGHVGLISRGPDGTVNLIHSTPPRVREEPIDAYIARVTKNLDKMDKEGKARLFGFKFLRLQPDPIKNLVAIDGPEAPRIAMPLNSETKRATGNGQ